MDLGEYSLEAHFNVTAQGTSLRDGTLLPAARTRRSCRTSNCGGRCALMAEGPRAARLGCELYAVTITSGDREHQYGAVWNVPGGT
jgi:hypothetical protein